MGFADNNANPMNSIPYASNTENKLQIIHWAEWCIYVSVNKAIIDSDNGFLPYWCKAIMWTNTRMLWI